MADVAPLPGLLEQVRLVAGLRWRILRNNMKNKNKRLDLLGLVISCIVGTVFVAGFSIAFFFGTTSFLESHHEERIGLLFWAIFLWWQVMPIFVAGFSPSFSFRTLLRFPLKFSAFYSIGIAYGLADSAALASLFWMAAMTLAVAVERVSLLPAMTLACVLFTAVNVTLERLIGSWIEKVLSKRRSRELFFALFVMLMVSLQFLGPAINKYERSMKTTTQKLVPYFQPFPGSLAGKIVSGSTAGDWRGVATGLAGLAAYATFFGGLLLLRYKKQYRGEELSETQAPARIAKKNVSGTRSAGANPGIEILPTAVSAMIGKETRYLFRNGFVTLSLFFPPLFVVLYSTQFTGAHPTAVRQGVSPDLFFPGMMGFLVLMLMAASYNCFAFEGRGMQTYFMVPVKFRDVLLGKNLMTAGILAFEVTLCIGVMAWRGGLPAMPVFLSTMSALIFAVVGQLTIANWSSLSFPKKMEFGKMQGQRQSGMAVLIAFGSQIVFGGVCATVLFAARLMKNPWLSMEVFGFLAVAALGGYVASLDPLTKLAEAKKETLLAEMCR